VFGERKLHQNAIDGSIIVEAADLVQKLGLRDVFGELDQFTVDASL
jgi:hypothetical protein